MRKGIKAKIDTGKVAKKTTKRQNKVEKKVEEEVEVYRFIDKKDDSMFLKQNVVDTIDEFVSSVKEVDNMAMMLELKKDNYEKTIENMRLQIRLIENDKRDVDTAIFHKKKEKNELKTLHSEFLIKVSREIGTKNKFGYNPDTLEISLEGKD
jgi:vacuolar-type H+-ATPase catalytic subunit A/Vma1